MTMPRLINLTIINWIAAPLGGHNYPNLLKIKDMLMCPSLNRMREMFEALSAKA
jgi:hypothetical protein